MRIKLISLALFICFVFENFAQKVSPGLNVNTPEDKVYGLSKVWSEVKYNFAHIEDVEFNIDSLYMSTIRKVLNSKNDIEYYDILECFLASFNDGHTQLLDRSYNWNDFHDYAPVNILEIDKKYYFSSIRKNAGLDSLLLGAEIIEIDNINVIKYIDANILKRISSSNINFKYSEAAVLLQQGVKGSFLEGTARTFNGEIKKFRIAKNGEETRSDKDEYWRLKTFKFTADAICLNWIEDIAVLTVNNFRSESMISEIDSIMTIVNEKSKALILDLRWNLGGSTMVANHLLKYFSNDYDRLLSFGAETRINDSYKKSQGNYRDEYKSFFLERAYGYIEPEVIENSKEIDTYTNPTIVLISKHTYSAAEDFLINLYDIPGRALFIGEQTAGTTGAPLLVHLPHDALARICTIRLEFPYRKNVFVSKGIFPDIEIKTTIHNYINDVDVVLGTAIDFIENKPLKEWRCYMSE